MLRRRGVGGTIPWESSSEASTWEAWLARRAATVPKRDFLSGRRRSCRRGCKEKGRKGRCRRLSRRVVVIRGHHAISRSRSSRVGVTTQKTPETESLGNLMPSTNQEIEEEEAHFASVVAAFRNYTAHSVKLEFMHWLPVDSGSVDLSEQ